MHIITIDGPASSGKGTVASIIAEKLGFHYLESGAIYRVIGLIAKRKQLTLQNIDQVLEYIDKIKLRFIDGKVVLDNEDVTALIRGEEIGMLASSFGGSAQIRTKLLSFQHSFAQEPGLVTDGRDMGSIVFPHASLKIFLTASAQVRATRRYTQLKLKDARADYNVILSDIITRDRQDSERVSAPLHYDESFVVLDNSNLNIDETVASIIEHYNNIITR